MIAETRIPSVGPGAPSDLNDRSTGSKVSRFTVTTDVETEDKMLIASDVLPPTAAVVELRANPQHAGTADRGYRRDSLTHAIEAFVSRKANAFADAFAFATMKAIWRGLPACVHEAQNRPAREALMLAAT